MFPVLHYKRCWGVDFNVTISLIIGINVRIWDKNIVQRLTPIAYSGIRTNPLMTFLSVIHNGRLHLQHVWIEKRQAKNFPGQVSSPWSLCRCEAIRNRRTKPLRHRATSAHYFIHIILWNFLSCFLCRSFFYFHYRIFVTYLCV